jgi:hypothetical protein
VVALVVPLAALAYGPAGQPPAANPPAALPAAGPEAPPTWAFLQPPLPDQATSCRTAEPASDGLVKVALFGQESRSCPVADVEGGIVTMNDLATALVAVHEKRTDGAAGKTDATAIVKRLVDVRLVVLEAQAMGIDELPEVVKQLQSARAAAARDVLKEDVIRQVKPDPKEVERIYRDAVREWKLTSVLFTKLSDAKALAAAAAQGKGFDGLAKQAVADKKAVGGDAGQWVSADKLVLAVVTEILKTKMGAVTKPVQVQDGWAVIQVAEVRYPENPEARGRAEGIARVEAQKKALKAYYEALVKRHAKIDEKLLRKLDYEAPKPGLAELKKDKRVLVQFQGEPPITVGEFSTKLEEQFYHGVQSAIAQKKLNRAKLTTIDEVVAPRVVAMEAKRLGVEKTEAYRRQIEAAETQILFGAWVQKAVIPDVKVDEPAVRGYYDSHKADFTYPAFYRLESIGFVKQKDAEAAAAKLRSGTDFKWLNANADGKLPHGRDSEAPGGVLSAKGMPAALAKALDGAKSGDYRVYAPSAEQSYAVHVLEVIPAREQPFEEARGAIVEKIFGEQLQRTMEDWLVKLRKAHQVKVFLVRIGS